MRILIVGSGPNWREAPFEDPLYEVWTYGVAAEFLPKVDLIFEMHRRDQWEKFNRVDSHEKHAERLNTLHKPVYMQKVEEDIPLSMEYPLEKVEKVVGPQFFSTFAYQLGLVALEQEMDHSVEQVLLYGFDLATYEEWADQRPNVNRLIGILQGKGVDVKVPHNSHLLGKPFKYGYEVPEEHVGAVDALIVEGTAQLSSMMARMADLYIAKQSAQRGKNGA